MGRPDRVEVWVGDAMLLAIDSSFAPVEGDLISIQRQTYRVVGRSFSIDHAGEWATRQFRCNIIVVPA